MKSIFCFDCSNKQTSGVTYFKSGMETDHKQTYNFCVKYFYKVKKKVQIFEVMCDRFKIDKICIEVISFSPEKEMVLTPVIISMICNIFKIASTKNILTRLGIKSHVHKSSLKATEVNIVI